MQPQPLPGQVFVRPGIDDRPDYEKTLTEETKAALKRLAVQQNPRVPELPTSARKCSRPSSTRKVAPR